MSAQEKDSHNSQETEGKTESSSVEAVNYEEDGLPSKSTLGGSNMTPSSSKIPLVSVEEGLSHEVPDIALKKIKSSNPTQDFEEIGSGDKNIHNQSSPAEDVMKSADDVKDDFSNTSSPKLTNIEIIGSSEKFSFLEPGVNLAGDDQDMESLESQDEDLVLKWDDDADVSIASDEDKCDASPENNDDGTTQFEKKNGTDHLDTNLIDEKANSIESSKLQVLYSTSNQLDQKEDIESSNVSLESSTNAVREEIDKVIDSAAKNTESMIDQDHTQNKNVIFNKSTVNPAESVETEDQLIETINVDEKHNNCNEKASQLLNTASSPSSQPVPSNEEKKSIVESEKSNKKSEEESLERENENLLFEIDSQISELDASISKAENKIDTSEKSDGSTEESKNDNNFKIDATVGADKEENTEDQTEIISKETDKITALDVKALKEKIATFDEKCVSPDDIVQTSTALNTSTEKNISNDTPKTQETQMGTDQEKVSENPNIDVISKIASSTEIFEAEAVANSTAIQDDSIADSNVQSTSTDSNFSQDSTAINPIKHGLIEPNMMLEIPTQELIDLNESLNITVSENMIVDDESKSGTSLKDFIENNQPDSKSLDSVDKNSKEIILDSDVNMIEVSKAEECLIQTEPITSMEIDLEQEKNLADNEPGALDISAKKNCDNNQSDYIEKETPEKNHVSPINIEETSIETNLDSQPEKTAEICTKMILVNQSANVIKSPTPEDLKSQPENIEEKHIPKSLSCQTENDEKSTTEKSEAQSENLVATQTDTKLNQSENITEASIILPAESINKTEQPQKEEVTNVQQFVLEEKQPSTVEGSTTSENLSKASRIGESPASENVAVPDTEEALKVDQAQDKILDSPEKIMDIQPSTSKEPSVQPSSSTQMAPDSSDDEPEVTDSLGLLAECSRVAEDDDEQETSDHDEDDDDFDPDADESSNQLGPELSEDSAQLSESDGSKQGDGGKQGGDTEGFAKGLPPSSLFDRLVDKAPPAPAPQPAEGGGDAEMEVEDDIVCEEMDVTSGTLIGEADPAVDEALDATLDAALDATLEPETPLETLEIPIEKGTQVKAAMDSKDDGTAHKSHRSKLRELLLDGGTEKTAEETKQETDVGESFVDLRESSSEDDIHEILKTQDIAEVKDKTPAKVTPRINTSEISIKTASSSKPPIAIPETKISEPSKEKSSILEVFNVDSDDEGSTSERAVEKEKVVNKCINSACTSGAAETYVSADCSARAYYQCKRRGHVCLPCLHAVYCATRKLVEGIKKSTPLLELEVREREQDCVEISDSDSEDEAETASHGDREKIIEPAILEGQLVDAINATWDKYKFERLLMEAQDHFLKDIERLEKESAEVNAMLDECQAATDRVRNELYASFTVERRSVEALTIFDVPDKQYTCLEAQSEAIQDERNKRRLSDSTESKAKRPIPPGYSVQTDAQNTEGSKHMDSKLDDDKDVSVVRLSAECPPPSLPPPGEPTRPPLTPGMPIYAMRHAFGSWIRARVLDVTPKGTAQSSQHFTMCRVKFENKTNRNANKVLPARCLAYCQPSEVRMTIGTRLIALFKAMSGDEKTPKRESFYSGVVAEIPNPVNKYRYLVFFDDGYAQYVHHSDTRLVCEFSSLVWEEVHSFSREFVKEYLLAYPERPMVRLHTGQNLKTEWNGKWWTSRVIAVDASLVQVYFEQDKRTEWIYRGSTRLAPLYLELQAAEKHRARPLPRNRQNRLNMPYVEYTRTDEADQRGAETPQLSSIKAEQEEIRRQRAVAKKSTVAGAGAGAGAVPVGPAGPVGPVVPPPPRALPGPGMPHSDAAPYTSRVVYYTPKNAVKPHQLVAHACSPRCRRTDVLSLKELRTYNPLAKPLLSGWERQITRFKGHKEVAYRAPCGRRIRNMRELHRYLRMINSDMGVDLFDFGPGTHCLAEFVLNKCIVGKKDLSHGKENVPVPCVNYYDDSLPEFCSYNTERTPTNGVPLNLDPAFLCGCDCIDDCEDKSKCACWKLTLEGARTIGLEGDVGYEYKRLIEPLPSGIYECNVRCKCRSTCLNRVAQHPLQLKLQVFKTANRGWGIRALNDVPKGSFLCIYAGNLLTDATANLDGLNEGDEYLAELDYIEVVEQMKEGYEDDIPDADKKLDKKESGKRSESESEPSESEEEEGNSKSDEADGDFEPAYIPGVFGEFSKRLRKRDKKKKKDEEGAKEKDGNNKEGKENTEEDCITISDDEEIREPSRFAAQAGMGGEYISKYRSVRSYFGKDEACYIMDAKVQGNIGRYLNHSCSPNVFVQNVFVDTHDPRFPWVAFFALNHIRAGTELTWNYNYDVGSVPGKALYCYCGAPNCRGRLL